MISYFFVAFFYLFVIPGRSVSVMVIHAIKWTPSILQIIKKKKKILKQKQLLQHSSIRRHGDIVT